MTQVTRVSAFMSKDGRIFLDADEAQAHQDNLDIEKSLKEFLKEKNMPFGHLSSSGVEDLIEGMVKYRNELLQILNP